MAEARHHLQSVAEGIHIPYNWEYADAAARTGAAGLVATDVGKLARQTDDDTLWMLVDDSPVTWVQVGSLVATRRQFVWIIGSPAVSTIGQIRIPWAATVERVDSNTQGGTSCTFNVEERAVLGAGGTDVLAVDMVADATGETVVGGFNNDSLAAGNYLTLDISAVSGVVTFVSIMLTVVAET